MEQLNDLLTQQVTVRADALLAEARPKMLDTIRTEVLANIDIIIEERAQAQLLALRPIAERNARVSLLQELATSNGEGEPIELSEHGPLSPEMVHELLTQALDPITAARGIKPAGEQWACAYCDKEYKTERAASMHSRKCEARTSLLAAGNGTRALALRDKPKKKRKKRKSVKRLCLKPGCDNPSKGPRFRFLCEDHKDAAMRNVNAWRKKYWKERTHKETAKAAK